MVHDIGSPAGVETPVAEETAGTADLDLLRRRLGNVLGHALRTPVTTVRGLVESVEPTGGEAVIQREVLEALHRSATRLEQLVDDLLLVSGLETGLPTRPAMALDPVEVARTVVAVDLDRPLHLEVDAPASVAVEVAPDALRWMLRCVLDNAARYGDGTAVFHASVAGDLVTLAVGTGPGGAGATDHDLRHAFEAFYRGERAVLADGARLGVGLTVAARLADHAGGRISLRRGEDGGVVTELELPRP